MFWKKKEKINKIEKIEKKKYLCRICHKLEEEKNIVIIEIGHPKHELFFCKKCWKKNQDEIRKHIKEKTTPNSTQKYELYTSFKR